MATQLLMSSIELYKKESYTAVPVKLVTIGELPTLNMKIQRALLSCLDAELAQAGHVATFSVFI